MPRNDSLRPAITAGTSPGPTLFPTWAGDFFLGGTMNQNQIVLRMLRHAGRKGITAFDGLRRNVFRLGARIWDLRESGYPIRTIKESHGTPTGNPGQHARYVLLED
jgi:hypothetical protein